MTPEKRYIDPMGRRSSPRFAFKSSVDLVLGGRLYKEMSENISDTGIFLKSRNTDDYRIFDALTLSFQLPDSRPVKHVGTVIRKTDEGIGILFSGVDYPKAQGYHPRIEGLFRSESSDQALTSTG